MNGSLTAAHGAAAGPLMDRVTGHLGRVVDRHILHIAVSKGLGHELVNPLREALAAYAGWILAIVACLLSVYLLLLVIVALVAVFHPSQRCRRDARIVLQLLLAFLHQLVQLLRSRPDDQRRPRDRARR